MSGSAHRSLTDLTRERMLPETIDEINAALVDDASARAFVDAVGHATGDPSAREGKVFSYARAVDTTACQESPSTTFAADSVLDS